MSRFNKLFITVLCVSAIFVSYLPVFSMSMDVVLYEQSELPYGEEWESDCEELLQITDIKNIEVWAVEEYELESMYGDEYVLRRSANTTEAFITLCLPYVEEIELISYNWPSHIAPFQFYFSVDGNEWVETELDAETIPNEDDVDRWTKIKYTCSEISGIGYFKINWPMPSPESNDWWNPYLGSIKAKIGTPEPIGIKIDAQDEYVIPRYDIFEYSLKGFVVDQLNNDMGYEVTWSSQTELPDGVEFFENGLLKVSSNCVYDGELSFLAIADITEGQTITAECKLFLKPAKLGDVNYDNLCDVNDLDFTVKNFRKTNLDADWKNIRLADINSDGIIDIVDLAYIAYNCQMKTDDAEPDEEFPDEITDEEEISEDEIDEEVVQEDIKD